MKRRFTDAVSLEEAGRRLGAMLEAGDAVGLEGPLGAGKTTLVHGIAAGMGVRGEVTSPTFTLMNVYAGATVLYHLDMYRLEDAARLVQLGYDADLAESGASVVEWADKHWPFWSDDVLVVRLSYAESGRHLEAEGRGERSRELLERWAAALT